MTSSIHIYPVTSTQQSYTVASQSWVFISCSCGLTDAVCMVTPTNTFLIKFIYLLFQLTQSQVIETLLKACPVAVKSREERWGRLPLHIACISKASTQVLQVLVEAHEESLRVSQIRHTTAFPFIMRVFLDHPLEFLSWLMQNSVLWYSKTERVKHQWI